MEICTQLLWEQTDFDVTIGQCLVSDENRACYIPIRHNTLSDKTVLRQCLIVDWGRVNAGVGSTHEGHYYRWTDL